MEDTQQEPEFNKNLIEKINAQPAPEGHDDAKTEPAKQTLAADVQGKIQEQLEAHKAGPEQNLAAQVGKEISLDGWPAKIIYVNESKKTVTARMLNCSKLIELTNPSRQSATDVGKK